MKKADMARRVARTMNHLHCMARHLNGIGIIKPAIGFKGLDMRKTEFLGLHGHSLDPEGIFLLRTLNRNTKSLSKIGRPTGMINVSVGNQNFFQGNAPTFNFSHQPVNIAAGVDHRTAFAGFIPENRAVLGKGCHGNNGKLKCGHRKIQIDKKPSEEAGEEPGKIFESWQNDDHRLYFATIAMPETLIPHIDSPLAWSALLIFVVASLGADFMSLKRQGNRVISFSDALRWSLVWVSLALVFCAGLWFALDMTDGREFANIKAGEFLTGYLIEKSLSVDNLFVFLMLFTTFHVPLAQQKKALMIGIIAAIVLRILLILIGAWLISRFSWVMYFFGLFLLYTGAKMVVADEEEHDLENNRLLKWMRGHLTISHEYHGSALYFIKDGVRTFTPLFLVVALIGVTDVMFAVDSIPAIFAVTTDPYIVMSSNIFAVLGLRALYFMLAGMAERFHLLKFGLAAILVFIGTKMLIVDFYHIPVGASLAIVLAFLLVTMIASLIIKPKTPGHS